MSRCVCLGRERRGEAWEGSRKGSPEGSEGSEGSEGLGRSLRVWEGVRGVCEQVCMFGRGEAGGGREATLCGESWAALPRPSLCSATFRVAEAGAGFCWGPVHRALQVDADIQACPLSGVVSRHQGTRAPHERQTQPSGDREVRVAVWLYADGEENQRPLPRPLPRPRRPHGRGSGQPLDTWGQGPEPGP